MADQKHETISGDDLPYVSKYRELTWEAVALGIVQGIVLNLAFCYAALKLGFSLGGSTVAAIMGYALLRGVLGKGTMVENNINQTIASGINTAGTGIIFTVPALFLLGVEFDPWPLAVAGVAGAILGVVVIVPLRKQMIEIDRLRFPTGVAVTTIIRAGSTGAEKARLLAIGIVIAAAWKIVMMAGWLEPSVGTTLTAKELQQVDVKVTDELLVDEYARLLKGIPAADQDSVKVDREKFLALEKTQEARKAKIEDARKQALKKKRKKANEKFIEDHGYGISEENLAYDFNVIPPQFSPVVNLSLMNVAAGMLAGRGGLPFFAGGLLSWWIIAPIAFASGWIPTGMEADVKVEFTYNNMLKPLGIGTLIGGALMGVVMAFPAIRSAFRTLIMAAKTAGAGGSVSSDELKMPVLIGGTVVGMGLFFLASLLTPNVTVVQALISAVVGTIWLALAALIVAQATGMTDISPLSGMSLISVTLMMVLLDGNVLAAMAVGVAVCVAIGQGADMMQDLKTGHMLGARPVKQQIVQFAATWLGALVALGAVYALWSMGPGGANGFGEGSDLPAPQAAALQGIIESVKTGDVPADKYLMGALVGIALAAAPKPGLGVLIGLAMYLPFDITFGYGCGCLLQMLLQKIKGRDFCENKMVPLCAGLIVGEALTGMLNAFMKIIFGS
jgi:uncharacterized oligopeptide transporter (OPT) family protein